MVKVLATNWGYAGSVEEFLAAARREGYDGVEIRWPLQIAEQDILFNALEKHGLEVVFLCGSDLPAPDDQFNHFSSMLRAAAENTAKKPLLINCHAGRDHYSAANNQRFLELAIETSRNTGISVCHETHRSRILFAAHIASEYIRKYPELKLTLDISHWCNVHESFLEDQEENVALALDRTSHIHARIGHPQGPQVNDPRAPEWADAVNRHFYWWDKIVQQKRSARQPVTFLTEFGPPDYMPVIPNSRKPLSDQWEVNVFMMQLIRERYL